MNEIKVMFEFYKTPWPKIQFKEKTSQIQDGYLYYMCGDKFFVSQNRSPETMGLAQNWIISYDQILKFYETNLDISR